MTTNTTEKRIMRHKRVRSKISGTADRPRLAVFRSNKYIYAQLIDDVAGVTIAAADSKKSKAKTLTERAQEVGTTLAKAAADKKITAVVFDRGGFAYAGAIKALAEAVREAGLQV